MGTNSPGAKTYKQYWTEATRLAAGSLLFLPRLRRGRLLTALLSFAVSVAMWPGGAFASGPPTIPAVWVTGVTSTSAVLRAEVNPEGLATRYHFEYLTLTDYEANVADGHDAFAGARAAPSAAGVGLSAGTATIPVGFTLIGPANPLTPGTAYRYRVVATNGAGSIASSARAFRTPSIGAGQGLPDGRAWEMVSPVDKGGGAIEGPGQLFGGGQIQAASGGGGLTYGSATAFGGVEGAPAVSQYLSVRGAAGWSTANISGPSEAGGYGDAPDGAPFKFFSDDLGRGLLANPRRCEPAEPCPRSYSIRESASGALASLPAQTAGMRVLSASPSLNRIVFESEGEAYEWSGGGLVPISLLPPTAGAGAAFQAVSADARYTFYTEGGRLYRYDATSETAADLTPSGGVVGVLAVSPDGSRAYYQDASGLELWHEGVLHQIAAGADATLPSDYPPATGTTRLAAAGTVLAFLSAAPIGAYDNADAETGEPDTEVYIYDALADSLICASCVPTGERPGGSASIPGALVNGSSALYRPRALSANGRRLFFSSTDALVGGDTNGAADVYQWEAPGQGSCTEAPGCVNLITSGRGEGGSFLDASAGGDDVFFLTGESLVGSDPGSIDAYDARVGGGLPEPLTPIPCNGDACQPLPSPPQDPTAGTSVSTAPNPPPSYVKERRRHRGGKHRHRKRRHRHHRLGGRAAR
jgi:hypothetical protein